MRRWLWEWFKHAAVVEHSCFARSGRGRQRGRGVGGGGGWRQARALTMIAPPSALVVGLLLDWADDNRSAWKLQRDVSNAYQDGLRHPMVQKIASVNAGRHAQERREQSGDGEHARGPYEQLEGGAHEARATGQCERGDESVVQSTAWLSQAPQNSDE